MNRQQIIDQLANHNRLGSKAAATEVLDELITIITDSIIKGDDVYLGQAIGGFKQFTRSNGIKTPKFRPSAAFKALVKGD